MDVFVAGRAARIGAQGDADIAAPHHGHLECLKAHRLIMPQNLARRLRDMPRGVGCQAPHGRRDIERVPPWHIKAQMAAQGGIRVVAACLDPWQGDPRARQGQRHHEGMDVGRSRRPTRDVPECDPPDPLRRQAEAFEGDPHECQPFLLLQDKRRGRRQRHVDPRPLRKPNLGRGPWLGQPEERQIHPRFRQAAPQDCAT